MPCCGAQGAGPGPRRGPAVLALAALVGGAAAADLDISWQAHSYNDLRQWPQLLRKGATWTKVDFHMMEPGDCAAQGLPADKPCFFMNHDAPTPSVRRYNTSDDLISFLASPVHRPYVVQPLAIAICFKNAPEPQCGSPEGARWLKAVDDFFCKANTLTTTLHLKLRWILDGDAWPRNCTQDRWRPWGAVWVPARSPPGAFTSNDRDRGFDRFQVLNSDTLHFPLMAQEGFGKFQRADTPYLVWEPSDEGSMNALSSLFASSAPHHPGLRFAINMDPAQAQVYTAAVSRRGWHAAAPGNLSAASALAAVRVSPSAFAVVAVDAASARYSTVLASSPSSPWVEGRVGVPLPGGPAPLRPRVSPLPKGACPAQEGTACDPAVLLCGAAPSAPAETLCRPLAVNASTGELRALGGGDGADVRLPAPAPAVGRSAERPLLDGGSGATLHLAHAWTGGDGDPCAVSVRVMGSRGAAAWSVGEPACILRGDGSAIFSLDVVGAVVAGDACGRYGAGSCISVLVAWADRGTGEVAASVQAFPISFAAEGVLEAAGPWSAPTSPRTVGVGTSVRLAIASLGDVVQGGDGAWRSPGMSNFAVTMVLGDGFCFNSETHNKQARVAVCDQALVSSPGVVNYVAGTMSQLVAALLAMSRRGDRWLTPCSPYVVVGTADVGATPGVAVVAAPFAPGIPKPPVRDPLNGVSVVLAREQVAVQQGSAADACGAPRADLAPRGQTVLAAWELVNSGWMP